MKIVTFFIGFTFLSAKDSLSRVNPYSAGIDFRRQYLTSTDVRYWRLNSILAL